MLGTAEVSRQPSANGNGFLMVKVHQGFFNNKEFRTGQSMPLTSGKAEISLFLDVINKKSLLVSKAHIGCASTVRQQSEEGSSPTVVERLRVSMCCCQLVVQSVDAVLMASP
ncbi:hypothetical protein CBR_g26197 [Chara braunii]|uniref:Uncharacterized protein n=1 Tax=Chara braunii TaxID=69332 RepID=A0A388L787_CHABU|nr:hypothetical protein CBR_g26197 [Chara braunii]|eukprot:GBG78165.1 hypothetical protein CBR_g26197 [Chara braunii]